MSLREYMPYGAPDLIEARERYTSRATMLATALAVATLPIAHAVFSRFPYSAPFLPPVSRCLCTSPAAHTYVPVVKVSYGADARIEVLPVAVHPVSPVYPSVARRAGVEGLVVVRVLIGTNGRVLDAQVIESAPMFDEAALAAARQWVFTPGLDHDHPVACWVTIPFRFRLH